MPNMIIKIKAFDLDGGSRGSMSISLSWEPHESSLGPLVNEWGVWDFNSRLYHDVLWNESKGIFNIKTWDVMWLWIQDNSHHHWRHVFILRNPPTSRYDDRHLSGSGQIFDARIPTYSRLPLEWKVKCLAGCYIS
jgi:hypothetical protein